MTTFSAGLASFTTDSVGHPFAVLTATNNALGVGVGPLLSVYPLDSRVKSQYTITMTVCVPQAISAFASVGTAVAFASCEAGGHADILIPLNITVLQTEKPPYFNIPFVNISTPGVATVNTTLGFSLISATVNPNTVPPWDQLTFLLLPGVCGYTSPQTARADLPALPFTISSASGALTYTAAVTTAPLSSWFNPLSACGVAADGGGLSTPINITVFFTSVSVQLSVYPTTITATHYAAGVTSTLVAVSLNVGTHIGTTWAVVNSPGVSWLSGSTVNTTALNITVSSLAFSLNPASTYVGSLACVTSGSYPFYLGPLHL